MKYSLNQISEIINSKKNSFSNEIIITGIATDSRKVKKGDLFIPFIGENVDGHKYIDLAFKNGAVASLSMLEENISKNIMKIDNPLEAIQKIAKHYLKLLDAKVIAITGSNGKTTTKDIINEILEKKYTTYKTQGNYNNELGVPLTILSAPLNTEILILEMGADGFNQLNLLSKLTNPDFAVITNIGESHIEFFKSREGIAKGKFEITEHLKEDGKLIFNGDEKLLTELVGSSNINSINCGFEESNDLIINDYKLHNDKTTFSINMFYDNLSTNLVGKHNILNIAFAIAIAKELNVDDDDIINSITNISDITKMRLEFITYEDNSLIINDAYNASPTSMIASINVLNDIKGYKTKKIILGDMFELGSDEVSFHKNVGKYIENMPKFIDEVISVGNLSENITNEIKHTKTTHLQNIEDCIKYLKENKKENEVLLFKASRGMKLEKIIESLLNKKENNE